MEYYTINIHLDKHTRKINIFAFIITNEISDLEESSVFSVHIC